MQMLFHLSVLCKNESKSRRRKKSTKELRSGGVRQLKTNHKAFGEGRESVCLLAQGCPNPDRFNQARPGPAHLPHSPAPRPGRRAAAPAPCGEMNGQSHPWGWGAPGDWGGRPALTLRAPGQRRSRGPSSGGRRGLRRGRSPVTRCCSARAPAPRPQRKRRARRRHSGRARWGLPPLTSAVRLLRRLAPPLRRRTEGASLSACFPPLPCGAPVPSGAPAPSTPCAGVHRATACPGRKFARSSPRRRT